MRKHAGHSKIHGKKKIECRSCGMKRYIWPPNFLILILIFPFLFGYFCRFGATAHYWLTDLFVDSYTSELSILVY